MTAYKVPQKEILFILNSLVNYQEHATMPGFEDTGIDMVEAILPEAAKFFEELVAPTNWPANTQPAYLKDNEVVTSAALEGVYQQMVEAGWCSLSGAQKYGGAGFPGVVDLAVQEMLQSANMGLSLLPMLTRGVIHALSLYGTELQKDSYLPNLISGHWSGTMNLTEPQAGSDLSAVKTKAVPNGDHYLISGQKIYITWGDHQEAENILHLVLARLPDAPSGNNGISLFLVPKYLLDAEGNIDRRNDVKTVGVEHKLGIHSSPTCTLAFGDNGGAVGYLVGPENQGLKCMFSMMNNARLAVGHQGVAIGERAYQQAVTYAADRVQGKVQGIEGRAPIIHHPDVKRMLLQMRALTEAGRAMSFYTIAAEDRALHHSDAQIQAQNAQLVEVMTPLVKGWCTEVAMESTSLGVQVHGGMGFIEETGAAQHMRDARILPIYEGTNGIQSLDFIGRKCLRDGGAVLADLIVDMEKTALSSTVMSKQTDYLLEQLKQATSQCQDALDYILAHPEKASEVSYNYMMLFGNTLSYWLLVRLAIAAQSKITEGSKDSFYPRKLATAAFFASQILTRNHAYLATIISDSSFIEFAGSQPSEQFVTD
jgi:alkylation response protein AidB-like acyl-CoA dehydrogenase